MTQNRSSAVMAQRIEPHDSLDFFPTPPWATRALAEHVLNLAAFLVWEPACGDGAMVRPLREYCHATIGSDVHDYGRGFAVHDFLMPYRPPGADGVEWIITNPPFRLAEAFVGRGLQIAETGVAVLVRSVFSEGVGRWRGLFAPQPPAIIAQFTERVPIVKGRLDREAASATAYCWMIWTCERARETRFAWIPPCRRKLERPGDYDG